MRITEKRTDTFLSYITIRHCKISVCLIEMTLLIDQCTYLKYKTSNRKSSRRYSFELSVSQYDRNSNKINRSGLITERLVVCLRMKSTFL